MWGSGTASCNRSRVGLTTQWHGGGKGLHPAGLLLLLPNCSELQHLS